MVTARRCTRDSLKWSKKSRRNWNSCGTGDSSFLTFCPTNLGTAIRARMHVRLPKLSVDYQRFKEIGTRFSETAISTGKKHQYLKFYSPIPPIQDRPRLRIRF